MPRKLRERPIRRALGFRPTVRPTSAQKDGRTVCLRTGPQALATTWGLPHPALDRHLLDQRRNATRNPPAGDVDAQARRSGSGTAPEQGCKGRGRRKACGEAVGHRKMASRGYRSGSEGPSPAGGGKVRGSAIVCCSDGGDPGNWVHRPAGHRFPIAGDRRGQVESCTHPCRRHQRGQRSLGAAEA